MPLQSESSFSSSPSTASWSSWSSTCLQTTSCGLAPRDRSHCRLTTHLLTYSNQERLRLLFVERRDRSPVSDGSGLPRSTGAGRGLSRASTACSCSEGDRGGHGRITSVLVSFTRADTVDPVRRTHMHTIIVIYYVMYVFNLPNADDRCHNKTAYTVAGQQGTACTNNCP